MFWVVRTVSVALAVGGCLAIDALASSTLTDYGQRLIVLAGLFVTLAVSLNLINGITGQFSIGHAAFYAVGAYTTGYLSTRYFEQAGLPPLAWLVLVMIVGALAAALAGFVVGLPSLRLRGDYLAIVTLGFGEIVRIVVQNQPQLGGSYGLTGIERIRVVWLVLLLAVTCIAVCRNLLKNAHGLAFLAVREDEVAGAAMGVNVVRVKLTAFMLGSAFAGGAGALLAHSESVITPQMFQMEVSFIILTMVVLGGAGSITGSALAAVALFGIPEYLRSLTDAEGNPLRVTAATVVAIALGAAVAIGAARWVMERVHRARWVRAGYYAGATAVGAVAATVGNWALGLVPALANRAFDIGSVRMVVFAGVLIAVMLLRPQGILGHHEFGWGLFRRRPAVQGAAS